MPLLRQIATNFTSGEISPSLYGRGDLKAYVNGAGKLRNVILDPAGAVKRRPGLAFIDDVYGDGRLLAFEFNTEQAYVIVLCDAQMDVYRGGSLVDHVTAPWSLAQLSQINWTQTADTLLVVHPDVPPKEITRDASENFNITDWEFNYSATGRYLAPHHKFAVPGATMGSTAASGTTTLYTNVDVFVSSHLGVRVRIRNKEVIITAIANARSATGSIVEPMSDGSPTTDWTEQAWSAARGWPVSAVFHEDRLVVGGSRDLPNRMWFSRSADYFNFDTGTGLDDESISVPLLSDQVNAIRHLFPGRDLQVYTSGAEWYVNSDSVTPSNVGFKRQTRVGSPVDRTVPPVDIDGATIFIPRRGRGVREFLYSDDTASYEAKDIALLSQHLVQSPKRMSYDASRRLLYITNSDGSLAVCAVYRDESVTAWGMWSDVSFRDVCFAGDYTYAIVNYTGGYALVFFDDDLPFDMGLTGESTTPGTVWSGLDHIEGYDVGVIADDVYVGKKTVMSGSITLSAPASTIKAGLEFPFTIESLPPFPSDGQQATLGGRYRTGRTTITVRETGYLRADVGLGYKGRAFSPLKTGQVEMGGLGWRSDRSQPLWRISSTDPRPCEILSVESEIFLQD